jgi:hypothetical protein
MAKSKYSLYLKESEGMADRVRKAQENAQKEQEQAKKTQALKTGPLLPSLRLPMPNLLPPQNNLKPKPILPTTQYEMDYEMKTSADKINKAMEQAKLDNRRIESRKAIEANPPWKTFLGSMVIGAGDLAKSRELTLEEQVDREELKRSMPKILGVNIPETIGQIGLIAGNTKGLTGLLDKVFKVGKGVSVASNVARRVGSNALGGAIEEGGQAVAQQDFQSLPNRALQGAGLNVIGGEAFNIGGKVLGKSKQLFDNTNLIYHCLLFKPMREACFKLGANVGVKG